MQIKLDDIIPNRFQPREVFDEDALNKLADSIKQHGVIEPILVRPVSNKYEIVAGERRYKASILAGLTKIPAMVRELTDKESSILAFIENEHRSNVSAIEEARTMDRILKNNNMTQEELAKEIGVTQSTIANKLRLLNLPMEIQESLMRNEISERHARSLLSVKDELKQKELLEKIKERKMTVRELDSEIKNMNEGMNNLNNQGFMGKPIMDTSNNSGAIPGFNAGQGNMDFMNSFANPAPAAPVQPNIGANFLGGMSNPMPTSMPGIMGSTPIPSAPAPVVPQEPVAPAAPASNDFMNFLNNSELPQEDDGSTSSGGVTNSYLNNNVNPNPAPAVDLLNSFNNSINNPMPASMPETVASTPEVSMPEAPSAPADAPSAVEDTNFMNFLNDYDNKYPLPPEEPAAPSEGGVTNNYLNDTAPATPASGTDTFDFLKDFNIPAAPSAPVAPQEPASPVAPSFTDNNIYSGFNQTASDNLTLNNVTPPITSNFNTQYVENNANYVDISKASKINNVDEIIQKLGDTIKEIKDKSVFKVDTEEINYDDIYQVTIKIDKRDF